MATSISTTISSDLKKEQLQEQIRKVRDLRQHFRMNTEPSRISGEDELYVGGYVHFLISREYLPRTRDINLVPLRLAHNVFDHLYLSYYFYLLL